MAAQDIRCPGVALNAALVHSWRETPLASLRIAGANFHDPDACMSQVRELITMSRFL